MAKKRVTRVKAKKENGEKILVIVYCRVSTDDQEDNGTSLTAQNEECKLWAKQQGYSVVDVVVETHSGYELEQRKKFTSVMERCKRGEADGIVFKTYDRLSRNKTHFTVIMYEAERYGYELYCVTENFNVDNIYEKMLREIVALFAELERYKTRERTMAGRRKRAEQGKLINGPRPRYGYTYTDESHTRYKIVEEEAEVIRRIDTLYLEGHGQYAIANMLSRENILTPNGNKNWGHYSVGAILKCPEYQGIGYAYYHDTIINEYGRKRVVEKPIEERIVLPSGTVPLIRTYETHIAIQERLVSARTAINSFVPKEILLRSFIRCDHCSNALSVCMNRNYLTYRCRTRPNNKNIPTHHLQIAANTIEKEVISYVRSLLRDLNKIDTALTQYIADHSSQTSVDAYDNAIEQVRSKQRELVNELKSTKGYARELLLNQLNELENETEKLQKYRDGVTGDGNKWSRVREDIEVFLEKIRAGNIDIDTASINEQRDILKLLGIVVVVRKDTHGSGVKHTCNYEIRVTLPGIMQTFEGRSAFSH